MKARSPIDHQWYYFVDKCLPFGASISCALFQKVSDAVSYLVTHKTGKIIINYLDDYLFAAYRRSVCDKQIIVFLAICQKIALPISEEKTFFADQLMTFLGFLLDTVNQVLALPRNKISKDQNMVRHILDKRNLPKSKRKMTLLQLQKICGFLNFLSRAIVPGKAFTR